MEKVGVGERESGDAGMDTGDGKVLGVPHAEDGDSGTDTGDTQVGGGPRAVLSVMAGLCASGWDDEDRSRDWVQGGG